MHGSWRAIVATVVLLVPTTGKAQAIRSPEPAPLVTAANADWQLRGAPIFYASNFYWPGGPTVFFNGDIMVRVGAYEGVPLYVDPFLPAYSVVYVPIGDAVVRPYVRRRPEAGQVGGAQPIPDMLPPAPTRVRGQDPERLRSIGTSGVSRSSRTEILSSVAPRGKNGIWIDFNDQRYYNTGPAVSYSAARFAPIGMYRGFPVYREMRGRSDEIFVAAEHNGPLTPYRREGIW
jgi:hypothetical protein